MDKEQQWQTNKDLAITWLWNYKKDARHDLKIRTSGWELVQPLLVVRDKACAGGKLGVVCWISIGIPS